MKHFKPKEVVQVVKINVDCASIFFLLLLLNTAHKNAFFSGKFLICMLMLFFFFLHFHPNQDFITRGQKNFQQ